MMTAQGVVLWFLNSSSPNLTTFPIYTEKSDPENLKLEYLKFRILELESFNFRSVWLQLCSMAQRQLNIIWQLLKIDPTMGVRALLGRNDITASFSGEVILIFQCHEVFPSHIFWNYSLGDTCYEYMPVFWNNHTLFILPGSTDLVHDSPIIPCEHHLSGIHETTQFNHDGTVAWVSPSGPVAVSEVPIQLVFKDIWHPFSFSSGTLFHDHIIGYPTLVGMLSSYTFRLSKLENSFDHLVHYSAQLSTSPNEVITTFKALGSGFGKVVNTTTHFFGHLISNVASGAGNLISSVIRGPLQALLNVVLIILLVGAVLYLTGFCIIPHVAQKCRTSTWRPPNWSPPNWISLPRHLQFLNRFIKRHDSHNSIAEENVELEAIEQTETSETSHVTPPLQRPTFLSLSKSMSHKTHSPSPPSLGCQITVGLVATSTVLGYPTKLISSFSINGIACKCMFDTGSSLSLIDWTHFSQIVAQNRSLGVHIKLQEIPSGLQATSVTGHSLQFLGVFHATVSFSSTDVSLQMVVLPL